MSDVADERRRRSWSVADLSRASGVHERTVRRAEAGEAISVAMRRRLRSALDLPAAEGGAPSDDRLARSVRSLRASRKASRPKSIELWAPPVQLLLAVAFFGPTLAADVVRSGIWSGTVLFGVVVFVGLLSAAMVGRAGNRRVFERDRSSAAADVRVVLDAMAHGNADGVPDDVVARVAHLVGWREVVAHANAVRTGSAVAPEASLKEIAALAGISTRTLRRHDRGQPVAEETVRRVGAARASLRPVGLVAPRDDRWIDALSAFAPHEDQSPATVADRLAAGWLPLCLAALGLAVVHAVRSTEGHAADLLVASSPVALASFAVWRGLVRRRADAATAALRRRSVPLVAEGVGLGILRCVPVGFEVPSPTVPRGLEDETDAPVRVVRGAYSP